MSALQRSPDSRQASHHVTDMESFDHLIAAGEHTFINNPALTISNLSVSSFSAKVHVA
jgi:hypothetical protein